MSVEAVAFLACGWSLASARTHATAIALQLDDEVVLVDAGGNAVRGLARTLGTRDLRHVYLTHEHPDHTYAFPGLVHHLRFAEEREILHVHGPGPALANARDALTALDVSYPFELRWHALDDEPGEDARARWAPCNHGAPTLAYRFQDVVVCGDTGPSERVAALAEGADLLVHEATHTDPERTHPHGHSTPQDAAEVAAAADAGTLALIHVHPNLGPEGARDACPFEPTVAPVDGDVLEAAPDEWAHRTGARPARTPETLD